MKKDAKCRFCGEQAPLQRSHIVPEFFYEYDDLHRHLELTGDGKKPRFQQKGTRKHLLCRACEQYFNNHFERPMKRQWIDRPALPGNLPRGHMRITGLDYSSFKLFHLSVLWRASIARHQRVNLGPHEATIHRMLRDRNPGPPQQYPLIAVILRLPDNTPATGTIMLPIQARIQGLTVYASVFGGCQWHQVIASHEPPQEIRHHFLTDDGQIIAIVEGLRSVKEIDTIMRTYEQNSRRHQWPAPWPRKS